MRIGRIFGLPLGSTQSIEGPSLPRGAFRLVASIGTFDSESLTEIRRAGREDQSQRVWATPDGSLHIESTWQHDIASDIWRRSDVVRNMGRHDVVIYRYLARFVLAPGTYEVYSQSSRWCGENQGVWQPLQHGSIVLRCEGGQTCRGATPYLCVRETTQKSGLAFHILPKGNWTIRVSTHTAKADALPFAIIELGQDDDHLRLTLPAGQAFEAPTILFHPLNAGEPHLSSARWHRYVNERLLPPVRETLPVVYNTWFDAHEWFTLERVRTQLAAARAIGCEVFVVDAGWYGAGTGGWSEQVGDWREKPHDAFRGRMADFAAEVRTAGLGFGLWMEPERLGRSVPVVQAHPDWFITTDGEYYYPDLENNAAYAYIQSEIVRLIETYKLAWLKLDFNFERGPDAAGTEYHAYYRRWYRLLDEVRARHPHVFLEGCSSGGLRSDLSTLGHHDAHVLTNTATPLHIIRIREGAWLRLPPGRLTQWAVLGPSRSRDLRTLLTGVVAPLGASWDRSVPTGVDFAARAALPGHFGLSGDLAGLPQAARERLAWHVAFFKTWRSLIAKAVGHLLTAPRHLEDNSGWAALQLQNPADTTSLIFAYRLDESSAKTLLRLRDLDPARHYTVTDVDHPDSPRIYPGAHLMDSGLAATLPSRNSAQIFVVAPA